MDASIFLTHLVQTGWVEDLHTSTFVFDIVQFFPSLNHCLLLMILDLIQRYLDFFLII